MDNCIQLAAIRGTQAHRAFYVAMMPYSSLSRLLSEAAIREPRFGRPVNKARLPAIAAYVSLMSEGHCVPPIHVIVDGLMRFECIDQHQSIGCLRVEVSAKLNVVDGQHRILGIAKALAQRPALSRETLPVCFYAAVGLHAAQDMFETINRKAVRPANKLSMKKDSPFGEGG